MAKQLNVNLGFSADTSKAKAQIQELQTALEKVAQLPAKATSLFDDKSLRNASQAALELQQHLNAAVNVNTGQLDLSRFSTSLKAAGKDLNQYSQQLLSIGPTGQQAFLSLARSIATADAPLTRVNKKLAEFGTTLKNTARWQISSSILHGFMGTLQSAYGYAQDLNRSLNDIRIVTGQSVDDMARFAETANRAAKALSTTTTEYTKASLIYYQQGLSEKEVQQRTDITVKMANASGQSAEIVSDQMTAVWNNFAKGTEDLEHFADAMTKLGAETASSSDEIAQGLSKFAAIGDTVGLSFDNAAAALATVTAATRESADTVGTAFKTIFARIQGLKLGETLEDGTDLNKYSEGLASVGINIKNQNGELKRMDDILAEMGAKWQTLSKDQQVALAQTVAGVRQYNQLMALMNNWDDYEQNLNSAQMADGTLQKQADIYAESWEAAQNRVRAAAEDIYDSLINDEFFIDLLNGFEKVLDTLGGFIDGLGGLQGVFTTIGSLFLTYFAQKMPETLNNLKQNIMVFTGQASKVMVETQSQLNNSIAQAKANPGLSESYKVELDGIAQVSAMKQNLILHSKNLTTQERAEYEMKIQNVQKMYEEIAALTKKKEAMEEVEKAAIRNLETSAKEGVVKTTNDFNKAQDAVSRHEKKLGNLDQEETDIRAKAPEEMTEADTGRLAMIEQERQAHTAALEEARVKAAELEVSLGQVAEAYNLSTEELNELVAKNGELKPEVYNKVSKAVQETGNKFKTLVKQRANLENLSTSVKGQAKAWKDAGKAIQTYSKTTKGAKTVSKDVEQMKDKMNSYVKKVQELGKSNGLSISKKQVDELKKAINSMDANNVDQVADKFEEFANNIDKGTSGKITKLDNEIDGLRTSMADMQFDPQVAQEMENAAVASADVGVELSNASENVDGIAEEMQQVPQGAFQASVAVTQFSSAVMSAYGFMTSIKSAIDVFGDEGSTTFEKVGAAVGLLTTALTAYNAVQALSTTLMKSDTIAKAANAIGSKVAAFAAVALGVGKTTETGAVVANTAAWYANPIMWIALIIVGVIAALVALVAIISSVSQALSDAYNKDAIAAENAEKAAENLTTAYEDAKTAYEEMIGAMDEYKSAREGLEELTKGTLEYEEALQKANAAALELIQNYPEYFDSGDYHWEDGELIINDKAMEDAKKAEMQKVSTAHAAATMATAGAKEARAVANTTDAKREQRDAMGIGDGDLVWTGIISSAIGAAFGPIGTMLGGLFTGSKVAQATEYDAAVDKALELYSEDSTIFASQQHLADAMAEVGVKDSELIAALYDNRESLQELGEEFNQASLAMKAAAENVANEMVRNNEEVSESEHAGAVAGALSKSYQGNYEEQQEKALKDIKSRGWFNTGTDEAKAVMAEYAKATGLDQDSNYEVTNYVGDGTVKINKTLEDGSVEEVTVTAEEIAATVAAQRASDMSQDAMKVLLKDFENLRADDATDQERAMADFLETGNFENSSKDELEAFQAKVLIEGDGTFEGELEAMQQTADNLAETLQGDPEDYGYDSWMEMANALRDAAEKTEEAWENIELPEGLENTGDLSLKAAQAIQKDVESIQHGALGDEGVEIYTEGINKMTAAMGEADKAEFMEKIGDIDWSNWYAMDDVNALLEEMGYELNMTSEEAQKFFDTMRTAGGASVTQALDQTKANIESVGGLLSEGVAPGSILDAETYEKLIAQNKELEGQFLKTIDGSYKYAGDKTLGIEDLGLKEALTEMRENQKLYEAAKDDFSNIKFGDFEKADYTFEDEMNGLNEAVDNAEDALDKANEAAEGLHPIAYEKLEADVDNAEKALESANDAVDSAKDANKKIREEMAQGLADTMASEDLMAVADKIGWTEERLTEMKEGIAEGNDEAIASMQQFSKEMKQYMDYGDGGGFNATELEEQIASTATSMEELYALQEEYQLSQETFNKAWKGLNEQEKWADMDVKEVQNYAKHLQKVAKESDNVSDELAENEEAAEDVALATKKMNKGIDALADGYKDWSDVLKKSDKASEEYCDAMDNMKSAMSDVLGVSTEFLSDDFIINNMKDIELAAQGDADAIDRLAIAAGRDILVNVGIEDEGIQEQVLGLHDSLAAEIPDIKVGATLDDGDFLAKANEIISTAGMTVDQANAYFSAMGFEAKFKTEEQPVEQRNPITVTKTEIQGYTSGTTTGPDGEPREWEYPILATSTYNDGYTTETGMVDAIAMATSPDGSKVPQIESLTRKSSGAMNNYSGSNSGGKKPGGGSGGGGGGGGNKKKPAKAKEVKPTEKKDKNEEIERYHEINEVLDDLNRELSEIGKAKDEAWGPAKLAAMDKELGKLKQLTTAQKQYKAEIDSNLAKDREAAAAVGAVFDEFGRITNYDEIMGKLVDDWNSTQAALDTREQAYENSVANVSNTEYGEGQEEAQWAAEDANDAEKEAIDEARDDADKIYEDGKKALEQYTETLNLSEEAQVQLEDYLRQIKELNYEKLMYKVEFKVEVNDRELKILDHYIGRMEDNFYKTAEVMAKIQEKSKFYESGDEGILDDLQTQLSDLETAFKNGEITQADYIDGLGQIQDMAMNNVDALYEMNSQMKEYYADVIDEGISKIQEMTSHFDHLTSKLQHYSSILSLMGQEQNYELQNNLLQGQIDILNDKIETSKATMAMLDSSLKSAQANYENATSEEDKEYWRERIVQISQALNEEEDAYLSYVEEVGDAANQILTNSIEKAFKEAELSMTNNLGFDSILADMERMNTLTDEFLTNTNKMYETNKMISSAQLAIDKTQNAQAKQKYQDYIKYIEQLQVSGNLTQTELQTAQARYKVLEAEIALEEAKNAKSEVRLTRDSEGNFGYVYTANQDEVANATQNYLDAQNELYNVGLENTKAYREKTVQLQQSTLEELKQLEIDFRVDHIISEEQYNQQKAAILETSNALLETYTEQFNLAQFTMATTSYNALMEEDTNFYNGQLSRNKEHTSLMEANDTEYYNGIKTTAETTQTTLETNLANFNAGVLSKEDAQYLARSEKDTKYYTSLRDLADGKAKEIDGIFNTNEDSLANKLKVDFYNNLDTALSNCRDATSTWQSNMQPLVEAVGVSFDGGETGEGLTQKIANTLQESKDLKDYITGEDGLIKGIEKEWKAVEDATLKWQAHWDKIQEVIGAYDELIGRTQQLIQAQAGPIANEPQPPEDPNANSGDGGSGGGSNGGGDGGTSATEAQASTLASQAMEIVQKVHNGTIKQDSSGWKNNAKAAGYSDDAIALALKAFNDSKAGGGYSYYYDKALELVQSYDTGGYTGEWGPEGRMAMLHEKELVLNAKDTENFLTATSMLREISQMLDNNALLASLGMINLSAMTLSTEADKVLQQEVTIHADFPNVTDHNEIEMAIDNLINAASQYANKK